VAEPIDVDELLVALDVLGSDGAPEDIRARACRDAAMTIRAQWRDWKSADAMIAWMSGSGDFAPGGKAFEGWVRASEWLCAARARWAGSKEKK